MNSAINTTSRNTQIVNHAYLVERIVQKLARRYPSHEDIEEMKQYGYIGLIQAISRFQEEKGIPFETYASIRIQGSILDAKRKDDWVPRSVRTRVKEIRMVEEELQNKFGRRPSVHEVSSRLGIRLNDFMALQGRLETRSPLRLDQEDEKGASLSGMLCSPSENPEQLVVKNALKDQLKAAKKTLNQRENQIIDWYYYDGATFKEIANRLGVTESRVSQIHSNICKKLRKRVVA